MLRSVAPIASLVLTMQVPAVHAAPGLDSEWVRSGPLRARVADEPADLVVFYGGEQHGRVGPCGCGMNPRGSLGRVEGYVRAARRAHPDTPTLLVNPGGFLDRHRGEGLQLRDDAVVANAFVLDGLALGGWDVLHLAYPDVPWVLHGHEVPPGAVSASFEAAGVPSTRVVEAGGLRVGFTGVSADGASYLRPEGAAHRPVHEALDEAVAELEGAEVDLVVVLGFELGALAPEVASRGDVDVLIDAGGHKARFEPQVRGSTLWVRSRDETLALGELRLTLDETGVVHAVDRIVDLDLEVPTPGAFRRLERRATRELDEVRRDLFGLD